MTEESDGFKLGRMSGIIDGLPARLDKMEQNWKDDITSVHGRIDKYGAKVEKVVGRQYWFAGAGTAAGAFIGSILMFLFGGKHV